MSTGPKLEKSKVSKPLAPRTSPDLVSRWEDEMEKRFDEFWRRPFSNFMGLDRWRPGRFVSLPELDIFEEKDSVVIKAEVPGLKKEDLEVDLSGSTLTIKGEKRKEENLKDEDYYCCERSFGSFSRSIDLPAEVKAEQVEASYRDGILEIRLPKTDEAKAKVTQVKIS